MASRDDFGGFTFAAFRAKNFLIVVAFMISPSLVRFSMFFFQIRTTHLCIY